MGAIGRRKAGCLDVQSVGSGTDGVEDVGAVGFGAGGADLLRGLIGEGDGGVWQSGPGGVRHGPARAAVEGLGKSRLSNEQRGRGQRTKSGAKNF